MVYFHSCKTCARGRDECALRESLKVEAKRLGITSMKHRCKEATPRFLPGDPVTVKTISSYDRGEDYDQAAYCWYRGHFVCWSGGRPVVFVPPGSPDLDDQDYPFEANGNGFIKSWPSKVEPAVGERADVRVCDQCGSAPGLGQTCQLDPHYGTKSRCLANTVPEATDARS